MSGKRELDVIMRDTLVQNDGERMKEDMAPPFECQSRSRLVLLYLAMRREMCIRDSAYAYMDHRIEELMIDRLVKERMPKSAADYIVRKAAESSLLGLSQTLSLSLIHILPYPTLARFGLTQAMIEDLPMRILKEIGKGGYSPVLPMRVTNENGEVIELSLIHISTRSRTAAAKR